VGLGSVGTVETGAGFWSAGVAGGTATLGSAGGGVLGTAAWRLCLRTSITIPTIAKHKITASTITISCLLIYTSYQLRPLTVIVKYTTLGICYSK
jgi:hypothetical protein